jgi:hypothetical protein
MVALVLLVTYAVGSIVLGPAMVWIASGGLGEVGFTIALTGHVWLIFLIVRECRPEAMVCLLIPFFPWYFAYRRWDIAKWPFLGNMGGWAVWLGAMFARA